MTRVGSQHHKKVLILSYHLHLGLGNGIFSFEAFFILVRATCPPIISSCLCGCTYSPSLRIGRPPHLQTRHAVVTRDLPEVGVSLSPHSYV
jgi:hypothetical protein